MGEIIALVTGFIATFLAGIFVYKAQMDAQELKKINKIGREYDKVKAPVRPTSDDAIDDILRK
ncbi:MAG: hypothetical protein ACRCVN_07190 [Spirochaetia bacterium]